MLKDSRLRLTCDIFTQEFILELGWRKLHLELQFLGAAETVLMIIQSWSK